MSSLDVRRLFDNYAATFATRDADAIVMLHSPDTQFWLRDGCQPVRGRLAVREAFTNLFQQWPGLGFEVQRLITGANHWVLDWALTATVANPNAVARPVWFDCLDIVTLDAEGLVVRKDTFVDHLQAQTALTADPARPVGNTP